jgi:DnaJ-class molecular chaperone
VIEDCAMKECPCCKGEGWFASHADGRVSEDCDICKGKGRVFDGMRKIKRFIRMSLYVIDCANCKAENYYSKSACSKCGHQFS